ncbi:SulP family inorganic anion transporter, partial [Staphylococcus equorum]
AIAFALIACVMPMIWMMSARLMIVIMSIFGHRRLMVSAPSSGVSLVAIMVTTRDDIYVLAWATLVMGIIQISLSFLKLNKVIAYIPQPIVIGFMNALGFLLLTSQLTPIFGKNLQTYLFAVITFMIIYT